MSLRRFFAIGALQIRPASGVARIVKVNRVNRFNKNLIFNDSSLKFCTQLKYISKKKLGYRDNCPITKMTALLSKVPISVFY